MLQNNSKNIPVPSYRVGIRTQLSLPRSASSTNVPTQVDELIKSALDKFGYDFDVSTPCEQAEEAARADYAKQFFTPQEGKTTAAVISTAIAAQLSESAANLFFHCTEKFDKDEATVARMVAYFFRVAEANCTDSNSVHIKKLLSSSYLPESYDEDTEVLNKNWHVPFTGVLHEDLHANFIARQVFKMQPLDTMQFLRDVIDVISDQGFNWAENGCKDSFSVPCPLIKDRKAALAFISLFEDSSIQKDISSCAPLSGGNSELTKKILCRQFRMGNQAMIDAFTQSPFTQTLHGGKQFYAPVTLPCYSNTIQKDTATGSSFPAAAILDELGHQAFSQRVDRVKNGVYAPKDQELLTVKDIPYQSLTQAVNASKYASYLIDRERKALANMQREARQKKQYIAIKKKEYEQLKATKEQFQAKDVEIAALRSQLQSPHSKKKENRQLARIAALEEKLREAQDKFKAVQKAKEKITQEKEEAEQMADALRKQIETATETDTEAHDLDLSVFDGLNIVVVGGHLSWAAKMRELHENVHVYARDVPAPDDSVLRAADAIWIQLNCISHPTFYHVVAVAKANKIPVRNFLYAGHANCATQLANEAKNMFLNTDMLKEVVSNGRYPV